MGSVTLGFLSRPKTEFSEEVVDEEGRQAGWVVWCHREGPQVSWRSENNKGEVLEVHM